MNRSSHYKNNGVVLEIQKIFTRTLLGTEGFSYKEKLDKLGMFSLEPRILRGDGIEVYKITRNMDRWIVPMCRGEIFKRDLRGKFFT